MLNSQGLRKKCLLGKWYINFPHVFIGLAREEGFTTQKATLDFIWRDGANTGMGVAVRPINKEEEMKTFSGQSPLCKG